MKLRFRGINYPYPNCKLETTELDVNAKFLGANYKLHSPIVTHLQTSRQLKYRGVSY